MIYPDSYVVCGHMTKLCPMSCKYKVTWQLLWTFLKRKLAHTLWWFFLLLPGSCCWKYGCSHWNSVLAHEDMSPTIRMEEQWVWTNPDLWWLGRRRSSYCPSQQTSILIQSYVGFSRMRYKLLQSCLTLCEPMDHWVPLSMVFSRQEYWSRLPYPPPRDLPDPGIKPMSLMSPALASGDSCSHI